MTSVPPPLPLTHVHARTHTDYVPWSSSKGRLVRVAISRRYRAAMLSPARQLTPAIFRTAVGDLRVRNAYAPVITCTTGRRTNVESQRGGAPETQNGLQADRACYLHSLPAASLAHVGGRTKPSRGSAVQGGILKAKMTRIFRRMWVPCAFINFGSRRH